MKNENHNAISSNRDMGKVGNNPLFDDANLFAGERYDELADRFLRATQRRGVSSTKQKKPNDGTAAAPE